MRFFLFFFLSACASTAQQEDAVQATIQKQKPTPQVTQQENPIQLIPQKLTPQGELIRVEKNTGGSTLAFKTTFADQSQFLFKPEQRKVRERNESPRYEIAAYLISDALGFHKVPRILAKSFNYQKFIELADKDEKLKAFLAPRKKELEPKGSELQGALLTFVSDLKWPKIDGFSLESTKGIKRWTSYLQATTKIPEDRKNLLEQVSNMIVFDFIIGNQDRWSGGNLLAQDKKGQISLVLIDNSMSFGRTKKGHGIAKTQLLKLQTFSKDFIARIRSFTYSELESVLDKGRGEYSFLIDEEQKKALISRCSFVLERIDQMKKKRFL